MAERNYLPVLVITQSQNNAEKINSILRAAGNVVRSQWADNLEDAEQRITEQLPDLIFSFLKVPDASIDNIIKLRESISPSTPVLAVTKGYDESVAASLISQGVRDLVSLENTERLTAIVAREMEVLAKARALESAETLLHEYQDRFHSILEESGDAIAYIQDGIHVSANPAWLELFGIKDESDLEGIPVMDLVTSADQGKLKTALKNAAKGKTVEPLEVHAVKSDETELKITLEFAETELDGEPCIELSVRVEADSGELEAKVEELGELEAKMEELGRRDPLTGLYHRHSFVQLVTTEMKQKRKGLVQSIFFIKPDRFSDIDDKVGPIASDSVLKSLGSLIADKIESNAVAARFGGNIFTVLVIRKTLDEIQVLAENLCKAVSTTIFEAGGESTGMTVSIGIVDFDQDAKNSGALISLAQLAAKQARNDDGNKFVVYQPAEVDEEGKLLDLGWSNKIKTALKTNKFQLVYQPIASLAGDEANLYDVLVRMLDENDEEIMPSEFIPAAERTGLMVSIDRWIIDNTFQVAAKRASEGKESLLFIRLSQDSLLASGFEAFVAKQYKARNVPKNSIVFQVAEVVAEKALKQTKSLAELTRKLGCNFAVEHFGIGGNPMQMFKLFKMNYVKIDGSFMENLSDGPKGDLVQSIVSAAKDANIPTVAERVEDANMMAALFQLGISYIQGNYVQEPEVVMVEDARLPE